VLEHEALGLHAVLERLGRVVDGHGGE
jgi:hypothetical protein